MTVHIAGLSEFQEIQLWKLNCICDTLCNVQEVQEVFWRECTQNTDQKNPKLYDR